MELVPVPPSVQIVPLYSDHQLMRLMFENCVEDSPEPGTLCLRVSRIGLKLLAFGCGIGGAVPNISVALKFGGEDVALGITVATSNFTTRTFLVTWSFHNMIDGEIGLEGKIRRQISGKNLNVAQRIAIKVAVFTISIIAQTPRAYLAYVYNHHEVIYAILTYLSLVAVPAYSLDLSFTAALKVRKFTPFERKLNKISKDIQKQIQTCRSKLLSLSADDRLRLLDSITHLAENTPKEAVAALFVKIWREGSLPPKPETTSQKVRRVASKVLSGITSAATIAAQTGFLAWVGKKGAESLELHEGLAYTIAVLIFLSNLYLTTKVMRRRSETLFKQILFKPLQVLTGNSVVSVIMPKARAAAGAVALPVSVFSTGTMVQAVTDYVTGDIGYVLKVLVPLSMFLLGHEAINELVDELFTELILACNGSETDKNLLKLDRSLKRLKFIVATMSPENFAKLLLILPDDEFPDFVKNKVKKEELYAYLFENKKKQPKVEEICQSEKQ
jgi:hypothetical protein